MELALVVSSALLWVVALFNLLLTLALVRQVNSLARSNTQPGSQTNNPATRKQEGPTVGERAPDFTAQKLNGETVTLGTYAGRSVAFIFVAADCSPCRDALPRYQALYSKAQQAGVELTLVSINDMEQAQRFVEEAHVLLPVLVAPRSRNSFMQDYNFSATPSYCLVDAQSKVQSAGYPSFDWGEWKALAESWEAGERYGERQLVSSATQAQP